MTLIKKFIQMSTKTDEKVGKYIQDYKDKIGEDLDIDLLRKITVAQGLRYLKVMLKQFPDHHLRNWKRFEITS